MPVTEVPDAIELVESRTVPEKSAVMNAALVDAENAIAKNAQIATGALRLAVMMSSLMERESPEQQR
jgi:hypothetical protein